MSESNVPEHARRQEHETDVEYFDRLRDDVIIGYSAAVMFGQMKKSRELEMILGLLDPPDPLVELRYTWLI